MSIAIRIRFFLLALLLTNGFASNVQAQNQRLPVAVIQYGVDSLGRYLVLAVRDAVERSGRYKLVDFGDAVYRITMHTDSPPDLRSVQTQDQSIISVVYHVRNQQRFDARNPQTFVGLYLDSAVHIAGIGTVESVAAKIVNGLDNSIWNYQSYFPTR